MNTGALQLTRSSGFNSARLIWFNGQRMISNADRPCKRRPSPSQLVECTSTRPTDPRGPGGKRQWMPGCHAVVCHPEYTPAVSLPRITAKAPPYSLKHATATSREALLASPSVSLRQTTAHAPSLSPISPLMGMALWQSHAEPQAYP